jgi:hypothetical protein
METSDVVKYIMECDQHSLDIIARAIQVRRNTDRETDAMEALSTFYVGDRVLTKSNTRPKYMANKYATLVDVQPGKEHPFKLQFDYPVVDTKGRRFSTASFTATGIVKA